MGWPRTLSLSSAHTHSAAAINWSLSRHHSSRLSPGLTAPLPCSMHLSNFGQWRRTSMDASRVLLHRKRPIAIVECLLEILSAERALAQQSTLPARDGYVNRTLMYVVPAPHWRHQRWPCASMLILIAFACWQSHHWAPITSRSSRSWTFILFCQLLPACSLASRNAPSPANALATTDRQGGGRKRGYAGTNSRALADW